MARTTPKSSDSDRASPAARSGWLRGLLRTLFMRQVRVKRTGGKQAVGLDKDGAAVQGRGGKGAAAGAPSDNAMHVELSALFKAAPGSREALRHLAAVQHGL